MENEGYSEFLGGAFCVPHGNPPKWVIVLTACIDESGQSQDGWMFLAGFVGNAESWAKVPAKWSEAIAPLKHLHMKELRFIRGRHKDMLQRAGEVPAACGLTPIVGGIRPSDYADLLKGRKEEKQIDGYVLCCFEMVIRTLLTIPREERLSIVFANQTVHGPKALIALQAIADRSKFVSALQTPDGTSRLASSSFVVPSESDACAFEMADYFAYALLQAYRDENSLKAKLCKPILDASGGEAYGAILQRPRIRQIVEDGVLMAALLDAQKRLGEMEWSA